MSEVLKAEWFDLDEESQSDVLQWLHKTYLPAVQASSGVGWVGHYACLLYTSPSPRDRG